MSMASGSLILTNTSISGNTAKNGGGIFSAMNEYSLPDLLTLDDCTLSANSATLAGGGIFNNGTVALTGCIISGNSAVNGGGIADMARYASNTFANYPAGATLSDCTVSGNSAASYGGGIENEGTLTLTGCTISGNSAKVGGGIANPIQSQAEYFADIVYSQATVTGVTISGNTAATYGGGIMNEGTLVLTGCTLSGNTAVQDGGGLANLSLSLFYPQGGPGEPRHPTRPPRQP